MDGAPSDRLEKLLKLLEREPGDAFILYGIALEYKKTGNNTAALEFLNRVIERDRGYCYAYYQKGLVHESTGDTRSAREAYEQGIQAARDKGDQHARQEIEAALDLLQ